MAGTSPQTPQPLSAALSDLARALDAPRGEGLELGRWRWTVRQRMAALRDALLREDAGSPEVWLDARYGAARRERDGLLTRLAALGPRVLEEPQVERTRKDLTRLVVDVSHHRQRLHDLAYDDVEIELGGSE